MSDSQVPLERTDKDKAKDFVLGTTKAGLSLIPVAGPFLAEYFSLVVTPFAQKRQDQWFQKIDSGLKQLQDRFQDLDLSLENLLSDENFFTIFLQATRLALINHNQENLNALRNALLNSALPSAPDEIRQKMFIEWAGQMTAWHIRILHIFADSTVRIPQLNLDKPDWRLNTMGTDELADIIESKYPETKDNYDLCFQVVDELHARGLLTHTRSARKSLARISQSPMISRVGKEFLSFIASPITDEDKSDTKD